MLILDCQMEMQRSRGACENTTVRQRVGIPDQIPTKENCC